MDGQLFAAGKIVGMEHEPRSAALGKAGGEVMPATSIGHCDGQRNSRASGGGGWSLDVHGEDMAQAVPGQACLLGISSAPFHVSPESSGVDALVIVGREAKRGKLRVGSNVAAGINVLADDMGYVRIAANKMVSKERMG